MLSDAAQGNWQLAEKAGDETPYGVQHLLGRIRPGHRWSRDMGSLIAYAHGHLVDPRGVLVVDETGFLKKGTKSAGVQRAVLRHRQADRTARWACSWPSPDAGGTGDRPGAVHHPEVGPATPIAARRRCRASRRTSPSPRSRSSPSGCSSGRGRPA
ncbi:MAG: hypothetical protein U0800_07575 [Isosphaeraceae bacterium]